MVFLANQQLPFWRAANQVEDSYEVGCTQHQRQAFPTQLVEHVKRTFILMTSVNSTVPTSNQELLETRERSKEELSLNSPRQSSRLVFYFPKFFLEHLFSLLFFTHLTREYHEPAFTSYV